MQVRIFKPARNAMQSGKGKTKEWVLQYDAAVKRQADPLMGWTSAAETRQQVTLKFESKEEAIAYAEREGLAYVVEEPRPAVRRAMSYSDNFRPGRVGQWTH